MCERRGGKERKRRRAKASHSRVDERRTAEEGESAFKVAIERHLPTLRVEQARDLHWAGPVAELHFKKKGNGQQILEESREWRGK